MVDEDRELGWMALLDVLRTERRVTFVRAAGMVVLGAGASAAWANGLLPARWLAFTAGLVVADLAVAAHAWARAGRRAPSAASWYLANTLDVTILSSVVVGSVCGQTSCTTLLGAAHLAYFLVIAGSALRLHVGSTAYAALLSAAQYGGIAAWALSHPEVAGVHPQLRDMLRPYAFALCPVLMLGAGALSVALIRRARRVFDALGEADRKHMRVVNQVRDGFLLCDERGGVIEANQAACRMFGLPRAALAELSITSSVTGPLAEAVRARWAEILDSGSAEIELVRAPMGEEGETRLLEVFAQRVRHAEACVVQLFVFDVTAARALEQQQAQIQRLRSLRALTSGAAHEFNNLLASIEASSFILREAIPPEAGVQTEVETISSATARAGALLRELLDLGEARRAGSEPVAVGSLLDRALTLGRKPDSGPVTVILDAPRDLKPLLGDEQELARALGHLVAHAYDAMLDGGTLTITARESTAAEIAEAGLPPGDWVTLTFRDTGIGMPADVAKGAFDPLHAAAGIGRGPVPTLPSVRAIVSRHGGSVTLESSVGLGSVFAVRLPAAAPAVEPAPVPPPAESEPRRSLRLLVVDDEPANRTSLSRLLSFRGHEVLLAEDGPCAIRVAEDNKGKIDLVLLDLLMPGMNGKEVLTALRARCPDLKVMMVTGYAEQQLVDESLELGAVGVAYKPFEVEKLFEQVQRLGGGAVASHGRASPGGPAA